MRGLLDRPPRKRHSAIQTGSETSLGSLPTSLDEHETGPPKKPRKDPSTDLRTKAFYDERETFEHDLSLGTFHSAKQLPAVPATVAHDPPMSAQTGSTYHRALDHQPRGRR